MKHAGTWLIVLFLAGIFTTSITIEPTMSKILSKPELETCFKGYKAAFALYNVKTDEHFRFNEEACAARLSPMSTFKICNSLIGLETGVVNDENFAFTWDGTKSIVCECNRDQTLQSAVTNSCVWYFRNIASAVGAERMQNFLTAAKYGNHDISGGITKFWLDSSLKISADEQVDFLNKLVHDQLPFSKRSMAIVRGLIRLEQTDKGTLYGKTGSNMIDGKKALGWFVGYVVQPGGIHIFATNIQGADGAWGIKAREITRQILGKMGLL
jgi:bla regulator protein BlaR1